MKELEEAQARTAMLNEPLIAAHLAANATWHSMMSEQPKLALPLDARSRANFMHCHVWSELTPLIDDIEGVELNSRLGFKALMVGDDIVLRLKYVGNGAPRNVSTIQQKRLARQQFTEKMTLSLTGDGSLDPPTLLTCGYTLDDEGAIGRLEIRRDCKGHLPWHYDIYGGTTVVRPQVFPGMEDTAKPAKITKVGDTKRAARRADTA